MLKNCDLLYSGLRDSLAWMCIPFDSHVMLMCFVYQTHFPKRKPSFKFFMVVHCTAQWCCEAPTVPNGVGVRPDTHPNALGKCWGNYLYISIQKRPVYADKLTMRPTGLHRIGVKWG